MPQAAAAVGWLAACRWLLSLLCCCFRWRCRASSCEQTRGRSWPLRIACLAVYQSSESSRVLFQLHLWRALRLRGGFVIARGPPARISFSFLRQQSERCIPGARARNRSGGSTMCGVMTVNVLNGVAVTVQFFRLRALDRKGKLPSH